LRAPDLNGSGAFSWGLNFRVSCITFGNHTRIMETDSPERIEELARQKLGGKSYTEIRAELKESGLSPEEIGILLIKVDEKVLEGAVSTGTPDKSGQLYRVGLVLAVTGLIITIAFNTGIILQSVPPFAVYAPFVAGIVLMFYGRMMQRRPIEKKKEGTGAIRRKRPFK